MEILNVSPDGLWLLARGTEYFLPYAEHPWFADARVGQLFNVEPSHETHLRWPDLDVDLHIDSLVHPERFPLKARSTGARRAK